MTAKMGGIDDVVDFDWPAAFEPDDQSELDESARDARKVFLRELERARPGAAGRRRRRRRRAPDVVRQGTHAASRASGRPRARSRSCTPTGSPACLRSPRSSRCSRTPRLIGQRGLLLDDFDWPDDWRLEAADRHRGLASLCEDDAELVAAGRRGMGAGRPRGRALGGLARRARTGRGSGGSATRLLEPPRQRREVLSALSPAMKEEVKRFLEPALIDRARGVLTRALANASLIADGQYQPVHAPHDAAVRQAGSASEARWLFTLEDDTLMLPPRTAWSRCGGAKSQNDNRISSLVIAQTVGEAGGRAGGADHRGRRHAARGGRRDKLPRRTRARRAR